MSNEEHTTDETQQTSEKGDSTGCGCGGALILLAVVVILYLTFDKRYFMMMPGEANMSIEALQLTFDNIDQVLPDSLMADGELEPFDYYSQAKSFGNIFYGLNPTIPVMAKADTSRKYLFQYVARVDHVDAGEFVIHTMMVDSIWAYEPFRPSDMTKNPFDGN